MRAPESFIGHRLRDLTVMHNTNPWHGFSIFRLQGPEDTTGIHIVDDPTISGALDRVPTLADCWIIRAEDYYGTFLLRVSSRRRDT